MRLRETLLFCCATLVMCCESNPTGGEQPGPRPPIAGSPYGNPIWSPDGSTIAFNHTPLDSIVQDPIDGLYLYVFNLDSTGFWMIDADGANERRVAPSWLGSPDWSPDGLWIAFEEGSQIWKIRVNGDRLDEESLIQLTSQGSNFCPSWSPDEQWIAYDSNADTQSGMNFIWKMKVDGSAKRRLAYAPGVGEIREPQWSPGGIEIVHIRYLVGVYSSEVFAMDSTGADALRLTSNDATDRSPKYSPDGTKIAFLSQPREGLVQIRLMDADGTNLHQLTTEGVGSGFSWSPDGREIVYVSYRFTDYTFANGTLWVLNLETGAERQLTFNHPPGE